MAEPVGTGYWKAVGIWVLSALLAAVFLFSGGTKLAGQQMHVESFARWGYPDWFRLVVGTAEVIAAVLLLAPRTAMYGAGALVVVMIGAVGTHVVHGEGAMVLPPLVLGVLAALVGRARASYLSGAGTGEWPSRKRRRL